MKKFLRHQWLLLAFMLMTTGAVAVPIQWTRNSAISDDHSQSPIHLGNLAAGDWTVAASIRMSPSSTNGRSVQQELFTFDLAPGTQIARAWVTWDDNPSFSVYSGSMNVLSLVSTEPGVFFAAAAHDLPFAWLAPASVRAFQPEGANGWLYSWNYTIHLSVGETPVAQAPAAVVAVPEPATTALIGAACLMLVLGRRRARSIR